jgi:hypothetical protein
MDSLMSTVPAPCPWDGFETAAMHFCERELCGWITQPANTWSNLAYVIVGIWLIRLAYKEGHRALAAVGVIEILIGIGSFFFHMSSTHLGEVVDVGAMYLLVGYALVINLARYRLRVGRPLAPKMLVGLFIFLVTVSIISVAMYKGKVGIWVFAIQAVIAGHLEMRMYRHHGGEEDYGPIRGLLVCFGIAWAFWWLDLLGVFCDPDNHFLQGHAIWHVFNSAVFYFLYRFYSKSWSTQLRNSRNPT